MMDRFLVWLLVGIVCIGGCRKDPEDAMVDEMVSSAKKAGVPLTRAQAEQMVKAQRQMATAPACHIDGFLVALAARNAGKAYELFDDKLKNAWPLDRLEEDLRRVYTDIGGNWDPKRIEFMNYPMQGSPVTSFTFQLTRDFESSSSMTLMCSGSGATLKVHRLKFLLPYQGGDAAAVKAKAMEFLSAVQDADVDKARQVFAAEYRDTINSLALQQIGGVLWDQANREKTLGEVERSISNGRSVFRVLADSQIHPMMKMEILLDKHQNDIQVVGVHQEGRAKMN